MPSRSAGSPGGTAQRNVVRSGNSGTGRRNRITSVRPRATTPAAVGALPDSTAGAPTMSRVYSAHGDFTPGASVRSIARRNALARTGVPSLKRKPSRSVNVYVLRSRETRGGPAHLRREAGPFSAQQQGARRVEQRPRRGRVGDRRIERVDVLGAEQDASDAAVHARS